MSTAPKRSAGPPPSAGVLARYSQAYAREAGVAEGRVRAWIAYMILAGVLERATGAGAPRFIVKGGVALELRLRDRARATKDIDVVLQHDHADLADTLERAVTGEPSQGFAFRRKSEPMLLDNGTVNMDFAVTYRSHAWHFPVARLPYSCRPYPDFSDAANPRQPAHLLSSRRPLVLEVCAKERTRRRRLEHLDRPLH